MAQDRTTLSLQQMEAKIKECTTGPCYCPIHQVDAHSYCGGKNSICGEEPLTRDGYDKYDPNEQLKFANCFNPCLEKANSYNGFAQKCENRHTGSK
jgi:hypothetical protein